MEPLRPKDWTLLFYNAGYADEGKMCTASLVDLEKVGSDAHTDVVAFNYRSPWTPEKLLHRKATLEGARTYHVERAPRKPEPRWKSALPAEARSVADFVLSSAGDLKSPELPGTDLDANPGDAETLKRFLVENMRRYPSRHFALFMSGHGAAFGGQAVVHDPEGRIRNEELARVFREVEAETGRKLDLLDLNTCFAANLETLYPLRDSATAIVASETKLFAATQPFGRVLYRLQQDLDRGRDVTGPDLARACVDEARRQPLGNLYAPVLSAFQASGIGTLARAQDTLQKTLAERGVDACQVRNVLGESQRFVYSHVPEAIHVTDVKSFASLVEQRIQDPDVRSAARGVQDAVASCVLAEEHASAERESRFSKALRLLLRRPLPELSGLGGISAYLDENPDGANQRLDQIGRTEYAAAVDTAGFHRYLGAAARREQQHAGHTSVSA